VVDGQRRVHVRPDDAEQDVSCLTGYEWSRKGPRCTMVSTNPRYPCAQLLAVLVGRLDGGLGRTRRPGDGLQGGGLAQRSQLLRCRRRSALLATRSPRKADIACPRPKARDEAWSSSGVAQPPHRGRVIPDSGIEMGAVRCCQTR